VKSHRDAILGNCFIFVNRRAFCMGDIRIIAKGLSKVFILFFYYKLCFLVSICISNKIICCSDCSGSIAMDIKIMFPIFRYSIYFDFC